MEKHPDFQKIAGSRQIVIKTAKDLAAAANLDPAHWAVIGMPLDSIVYNQEFLKLVDTDENNRIRPDELRNAILWLLGMLKNHHGIETGSTTLKLSALDLSAPGAENIFASAKIILQNLGIPDADEVTLDQVLNRNNIVLNSCGNGDGVITSEHNENNLLAEYIKDAISVCGGTPDITGLSGIDLAITKKFQGELENFRNWYLRKNEPQLTPFGADTDELYAKYIAAEEVIVHYFKLCHAVADGGTPRFTGLSQLDPLNTKAMAEFLENAPCAIPSEKCELSANGWINPANGAVIAPLLQTAYRLKITASEDSMTEAEWNQIAASLAPRKGWLCGKPAGPVSSIPEEKVEKYLNENAFQSALDLIESDISVKKEIEAYTSLRKLIIYQSCILEFVNNFINLSALFNPNKLGLVQSGYLIMDGRHYTLSCKVTDIGSHKKIIMRSNICVMYVNLTTGKPGAVKKMTLAVAITSGTMRDIYIGRSGVFIGKDGTEWDATVIDFIQQPVSLGEAIQMPFFRFGEFLGKQADKFFSSKSKAMETSVGSDLAKGALPKEIAQSATKQTPAISGSMMLMGGGVGLAALGSAFALIVNSLKAIPVWNVLLVLVGIILIISGPMMLVSIVKLCRRHISDFLSASGWAVNPKMRLANRMGMIFTHTPKLPAGSRFICGDIVSAFAKKYVDKSSRKRKIIYWILFVLVLIWVALMIYLKWFFGTGI